MGNTDIAFCHFCVGEMLYFALLTDTKHIETIRAQ